MTLFALGFEYAQALRDSRDGDACGAELIRGPAAEDAPPAEDAPLAEDAPPERNDGQAAERGLLPDDPGFGVGP